ncbi:MAG: hypothetical protein AAF985_02350 [Bacteroidota bacterium]
MKKLTLLGLILSLLCCYPNDIFAQSEPLDHITIANMGGDGFNGSCYELDIEDCFARGLSIQISVAHLQQYYLYGAYIWPVISNGNAFGPPLPALPPNLYVRYSIGGYTSPEILAQNFQQNADHPTIYTSTIDVIPLASHYLCDEDGEPTLRFIRVELLRKNANSTYSEYPLENYGGAGEIFDCNLTYFQDICDDEEAASPLLSLYTCCGCEPQGLRYDEQNSNHSSLEGELEWTVSPNHLS